MMRLVEVAEKPRRNTRIATFLDEFSRMDAKIVEVVGAAEHYSNMHSAQGNWQLAIVRYGYRMHAFANGNKLYLEKLD